MSRVRLWAKRGGALLLLVVVAACVPAAAEKEKLTLEELICRLPPRVQDKDGTPGDMVNFVLVGPRERVEQALAAAGWQPVDRTKKDAALRAVLDTLQKKPYTQMPMSELFLFRPHIFQKSFRMCSAVLSFFAMNNKADKTFCNQSLDNIINF